MMNPKVAFAIVLAGAALAGCGGSGGGGSNDAGSDNAVPSSAFASADAFVAYVRSLAADDASEPLKLPDLAAPTSDTAEPSA